MEEKEITQEQAVALYKTGVRIIDFNRNEHDPNSYYGPTGYIDDETAGRTALDCGDEDYGHDKGLWEQVCDYVKEYYETAVVCLESEDYLLVSSKIEDTLAKVTNTKGAIQALNMVYEGGGPGYTMLATLSDPNTSFSISKRIVPAIA